MSDQASSILGKFLRKDPRWPDPQRSIGQFLMAKGQVQCWKAVGPARAAFVTLGQEIKDLEDTIRTKPGSDPVTYSVFMMGRSASRARPTILFCSEDVRAREAVQAAVEESGLMERYPGIRLRNTSRAPDINDHGPPQLCALDHIAIEPLPASNRPVISGFIHASNNKIFASQSLAKPPEAHVSTFGGIARCNGEIFMFTAGHAFETQVRPDYANDPTLGDKAWELDSDDDSDVTDLDHHLRICELDDEQTKSQSALVTFCEDMDCRTPPSVPDLLELSPMKSDVEASPSTEHRIDAFSSSLDYALIKSTTFDPSSFGEAGEKDDFFDKFDRVLPVPIGIQDSKVISYVASIGYLTGTLDATPSYIRMPYRAGFQKTYRVDFDGPISKGDSGSWVLDAETQGLYGHIIASCENSTIAYIIASTGFMEDAQKQLGGNIQLYCHPRVQNTASAVTKDSGNIGLEVEESVLPKSFNPRGSPKDLKHHSDHRYRRDDRPFVTQTSLKAFLGDMSLAKLREAEKLPPIVWVDDTTFNNGNIGHISKHGPLTAWGLYQMLNESRSSNAMHSINNSCPDAERRLIFIPDLDRWTAFAILSTVRREKASMLCSAISRHLASDTVISVTENPMNGNPGFEFTFHLPFFVLRNSEASRTAPRQVGHESILRHSCDVSFLNRKAHDPAAYSLHEAQISCAVTGPDENRWIAYSFVDTYDSEPRGSRENVFDWEEESEESDERASSDMLRSSHETTTELMQDPRQYFLSTFCGRLRQVRDEWRLVVEALSQHLRVFTTANDSHDHVFSGANHEKQAEALAWLTKTRQLSRRLSDALCKTVDACERFMTTGLSLLASDDGKLGDPSVPTITVHESVETLKALKVTLKTIEGCCDGYLNDASIGMKRTELQLATKAMHMSSEQLQLSILALQLGERQAERAKLDKELSWRMMAYVSPIALTASIFSMDSGTREKVLPFISPSWKSFFLLIMFLAVVNICVMYAHPRFLKHWSSKKHQKQENSHGRPPDIESLWSNEKHTLLSINTQ